jgi:hypothetical protein
MEENELIDPKNLSQEEKSELISSWIEKYEIKKIVVKRPDLVFYLEE